MLNGARIGSQFVVCTDKGKNQFVFLLSIKYLACGNLVTQDNINNFLCVWFVCQVELNSFYQFFTPIHFTVYIRREREVEAKNNNFFFSLHNFSCQDIIQDYSFPIHSPNRNDFVYSSQKRWTLVTHTYLGKKKSYLFQIHFFLTLIEFLFHIN